MNRFQESYLVLIVQFDLNLGGTVAREVDGRDWLAQVFVLIDTLLSLSSKKITYTSRRKQSQSK